MGSTLKKKNFLLGERILKELTPFEKGGKNGKKKQIAPPVKCTQSH